MKQNLGELSIDIETTSKKCISIRATWRTEKWTEIEQRTSENCEFIDFYKDLLIEAFINNPCEY